MITAMTCIRPQHPSSLSCALDHVRRPQLLLLFCTVTSKSGFHREIVLVLIFAEFAFDLFSQRVFQTANHDKSSDRQSSSPEDLIAEILPLRLW